MEIYCKLGRLSFQEWSFRVFLYIYIYCVLHSRTFVLKYFHQTIHSFYYSLIYYKGWFWTVAIVIILEIPLNIRENRTAEEIEISVFCWPIFLFLIPKWKLRSCRFKSWNRAVSEVIFTWSLTLSSLFSGWAEWSRNDSETLEKYKKPIFLVQTIVFSTHAGQSSRNFLLLFSKINTDHVYIVSQGSLMTKCSAVILSEKTIIIENITDKEGTKYKAKRFFLL